MTPRDSPRGGDPASSDSQRSYEVRHRPEPDQPLFITVTKTVAAVTGIEVEALRPLYEVVEPNALEDLFAPASGTDARSKRTGHVTFSYEGCLVRVFADGEVVVVPPEEE